MSKKNTFKKKLKVVLCKIFWYLFVLQSLYIIYSIAPKPQDPIITMVNDFATLSGPNIIQEGNISQPYTITLNQDLRQDLNITLAYSSTAKEGEDYIAVKHLHIKKGEFSKSFRITTLNDMIKEDNDVFAVKIKTIRGHKFLKDYNASERNSIVFTKIVDENKPKHFTKLQVNFDKRVYENQAISYTLESKEPLLEDLLLEYEVSSLDVKSYKKIGQVLFKKGTKEVRFSIPIKDDNVIEKSQYIEIRFKPIISKVYESVQLNKEILKTTIVDEKTTSSIETAKVSVLAQALKSNHLTEDMKKFKITLKSTQKVLQDLPIKVHYIGAAKNDKDFIAPKDLVLEKGKQELTFYFEMINDNIKEPSKKLDITFELLGNGGLENIELQNKLHFILEDEKISSSETLISFKGPGKVLEPHLSKEYTISSTQTLVEDLTVHLSYKGSTAKPGTDFIMIEDIIIPAGKMNAHFKIKILDDKDVEKLENIVIQIDSIKGGGLENIILSDDILVTTKVSDEIDITNAFQNLITNKKIVFEMASDKISAKSPHALNDIASLLKEFPKAVLVIEGHTNHLGIKKHNIDLSQRRAQKVKNYIISRGISKKRLQAVGYGDSKPMVPIDSTNAIELNKRVDFKVKY